MYFFFPIFSSPATQGHSQRRRVFAVQDNAFPVFLPLMRLRVAGVCRGRQETMG